MKKNTKAIAESVGEVTKHIIHFKSGHEKTFENVISSSVKVGSFTKMKTTQGYSIGVQHKEVEWFEIHPQE